MALSGRVAFGKMESVTFGKPFAEAVAAEVESRGAERVFLMVSGTLNRETGEIAKLRRAFGNKVAGEFDRMAPHTPRRDVLAAADAAREAGADLIVTFGGGSITDGAKAVALCLANDIREPDRIDMLRPVAGPDGALGPPPVNPPAVPQITIPTTLSGGEFSAISGVTDERTRTKELLRHPDIMPRAVILDPAPTVHTPEWLFLSTGVRAVDHCVEGVCSLEAHPYGDALALQGLALLTSGLARVKADPGDIDARLDCQMGTWMSMAPLASGVPMGRATASATSSAPSSTSPTATPRASCCPRSCAGTGRSTPTGRRRSRGRWATRARTRPTCSAASLPASACRGASPPPTSAPSTSSASPKAR